MNALRSDKPSNQICTFLLFGFSQKQSHVSITVWLLFRFSNLEPLTDVVYFDVWSDCVVGRSLAGVVICLGNCGTRTGRGRAGRTSTEAEIGGERKNTFELANAKRQPVKAEQLSPFHRGSVTKPRTPTAELPSDH